MRTGRNRDSTETRLDAKNNRSKYPGRSHENSFLRYNQNY